MRIRLLDRVLLVAICWRLRDGAFVSALIKLLGRMVDEQDREERRAQQAAAERARYAAGIAQFKSFESGNGLRLQ